MFIKIQNRIIMPFERRGNWASCDFRAVTVKLDKTAKVVSLWPFCAVCN